METIKTTFTVQKEIIPFLLFEKIKNRKVNYDIVKKLENAVLLGNGYRSKVQLKFEDDEGVKQVETTIWACGDKFICLKGGVWMPIASIIEVNS